MKSSKWHIMIGAVFTMLWLGCANRLSIDGGPRDETPPQIVVEKSTPSGQTDWQASTIELTFDEYIDQQVAADQIIVSPPLNYPLRAMARGKRLQLEIDERDTLQENTTYIIQLGSAVKDLTEGNAAEDVTFIFSTGSRIDSAELHVMVMDYNTQEPVEDIWVLAYTSESDTVLRRGRPSYLAKTDATGKAILANMPATSVQVYALMDENRNYRFDSETEQVGFLDRRVTSMDDPDTVHFIYLFKDQKSLQVVSTGRITDSTFIIVANEVAQQSVYAGLDTLTGQMGDTLRPYFMKNDTLVLIDPSRPDLLVATSPYGKADTLSLSSKDLDLADMLGTLQLVGLRSVIHQDTFYQRTRWSGPIDDIDTSAIYRWDTASATYRPLDGALYDLTTSADLTTLDLMWPMKGSIDSMWYDSAALSSRFGASDSILLATRPATVERLSHLRLTLTGMDSTERYLVDLIASDGEVMMSTMIEGQEESVINVPSLPPVGYKLEIVTDKNKNGRWDAGLFDLRRRPEPRQEASVDRLRANWDVEQTVQILRR